MYHVQLLNPWCFHSMKGKSHWKSQKLTASSNPTGSQPPGNSTSELMVYTTLVVQDFALSTAVPSRKLTYPGYPLLKVAGKMGFPPRVYGSKDHSDWDRNYQSYTTGGFHDFDIMCEIQFVILLRQSKLYIIYIRIYIYILIRLGCFSWIIWSLPTSTTYQDEGGMSLLFQHLKNSQPLSTQIVAKQPCVWKAAQEVERTLQFGQLRGFHPSKRALRRRWFVRNPGEKTSWLVGRKYPVNLQGFYIYIYIYTSQVVVWDFWTINSSIDFLTHHQD